MHKASGKYTIVYMTINSVIIKVLFHVDNIMHIVIYIIHDMLHYWLWQSSEIELHMHA